MASVACSYCGRKGILIYPLRYAVACPNGKDDVPGLSGNFKIDGGPVDISPAKYILRALRTGYLYTYEEQSRKLKAYMVLPNGALWEFPVEYIPSADPDRMGFCCTDKVSVSLSYCIDVDPISIETAGNVWLAWSNVLWTRAILSKISDINWRKKHMQCINLKAMVQGAEAHTATFRDALAKVPHFASEERALKKAYEFSTSSLQSEIEKQVSPQDMGKLLNERCQYGGFVIAVNDPVGICSDLSALTLPTDDAGFNKKIYWGKISGNLVDSIKDAFEVEANQRERRKKALAQAEKKNPVLRAYSQWGKSIERMSSNYGGKNNASSESDSSWDKFIAPDGKSLIDHEARRRFTVDYEAALLAFQPTSSRFDTHHTAWLRSKQLRNWMQATHDSSDIRSGVCYRESLAQCIGKSSGNLSCGSLLKQWLSEGSPSDEGNLYVRAMIFNQELIAKAAEPHLKSNDMPLEGIFNLYKRSVELVSKNGVLNSFDRIALSTANILVSSFSKGASIIARNLTLIGLTLTGEIIVKPSSATVADIQKWILEECKRAGVQLNENRLRTLVFANKVAKQALNDFRRSAANVAIGLDVDQLRRQGLVRPESVQIIKIPGVEQAKRWISSDAPNEFKLGVVTMILQLVALSFATLDLVNNDETNRLETRWKATFGSLTLLSSISETAMATLAVRPEHPLSKFIAKHWESSTVHASSYALLARAAGFITGVAVACLDIAKGLTFIAEKNYVKGGFYVILGGVTIVLSGLACLGVIACWWLLVAAVIFSLISPLLNEVALQQWLGRSFFGTARNKFLDLDSELLAYKSAIGG